MGIEQLIELRESFDAPLTLTVIAIGWMLDDQGKSKTVGKSGTTGIASSPRRGGYL